jgi:hypothetical protein
LFSIFEDTYKMGDSDDLHATAALALDIMQNDRPFTEMLTAPAGNCPTVTFDADGIPTVTAADCASGYPDGQAGVLTSQQFQSQFYSNMAFKRVRAVHELFDCRAMPGATRDEPVELPDGKFFEGEFEFETITGINNSDAPNVDFQDTSAVICANCHSAMNHQAPLFLNFDAAGIYQAESQVIVPVPGEPLAQVSDYLVDGEPFAWRPGVTTNNLVELGAAMAEDPAVIECFVARAWNWTMGRNDIVDAVAGVPTEVIQPFIDSFVNNNYNYKELVRSMFKSDDFILF